MTPRTSAASPRPPGRGNPVRALLAALARIAKRASVPFWVVAAGESSLVTPKASPELARLGALLEGAELDVLILVAKRRRRPRRS